MISDFWTAELKRINFSGSNTTIWQSAIAATGKLKT
jgi:hypothetical protein